MLIANRPLPKSHPRNRPSGATPQKKRSRRDIPGWLWLVAGLGGGMLLASLVNLAAHRGANPGSSTETQREVVKPVEPARAGPAEKTAGKPAPAAASRPAEKPSTKFDFYTLLPEQEVIEPNERPAPAPAAAKAGREQKPPAPAAPASEPAPGEQFILQAGSFKSAAEAERRRAQVQALGLPNRQESVSAGGDTWYRVLVGPFPSRDAATQARDRLTGQSIDTIIVRKKTAG